MKKVECFMNPSALDELKDDLLAVGVEGMSVLDASGFGRQHGHMEHDDPAESVKFLKKLKLEIVVDEEMVDQVVAILRKLASDKTIGAGKIFVIPVEDAVRISTAESGKRAIY
ncbi:MAG: P-II family nitrogen regulator [Planctomycetes bacterium]|nr:P-II family nitrogen regulator [Planctomycetota bacterium]